jgi:hypothetical protein
VANNKNQEANTNNDDNLRGGTQGGGATAAQPQIANAPGGTNSLSPSGSARPLGRVPEPPTGDKFSAGRQDPQRALGDGPTKESESAAKQRARDDANVEGSTSGIDEGNPRQIPEDAPTADGRTGND